MEQRTDGVTPRSIDESRVGASAVLHPYHGSLSGMLQAVSSVSCRSPPVRRMGHAAPPYGSVWGV